MNRKNIAIILSIVIVLILLITLLTLGNGDISSFFILGNNPEKITIGFAVPLTGKASSYASDMINGSELALELLKSKNKDNIKFVFEDTTGLAEKAVSALNKLINFDNARIIVSISSNEMLAIAPITQEKKVILFTPIAGAEEISLAGDYVFRNRETATYS